MIKWDLKRTYVLWFTFTFTKFVFLHKAAQFPAKFWNSENYAKMYSKESMKVFLQQKYFNKNNNFYEIPTLQNRVSDSETGIRTIPCPKYRTTNILKKWETENSGIWRRHLINNYLYLMLFQSKSLNYQLIKSIFKLHGSVNTAHLPCLCSLDYQKS